MAATIRYAIAKAIAQSGGVQREHVLPLIQRSKTADFSIPTARLLPLQSCRKNEGVSSQVLPAVTAALESDTRSLLDSSKYTVHRNKHNQVLVDINPLYLATVVLQPATVQKCTTLPVVGTRQRCRKIVLEFSSPNIAKPFHAGHLRSTIIGGFLARLHTFFGHEVVTTNYLGDWGKQFGLLGIGFDRFGNEAALQENAIQHLFDVYVKANAEATADYNQIHEQARSFFRNLENGSAHETNMWKKFRKLSIEAYNRTYEKLSIRFDHVDGESMYGVTAARIADEFQQHPQVLIEDNGATVADLGALGRTVLQKQDGTTVYLTRDIAAAEDRMRRHEFDDMIYVAGAPQDLHFKQLFALLHLRGHSWAQSCHHVNFGSVQGMSTRRGNVVFLDDILNEATQRMLEIGDRGNLHCNRSAEERLRTAAAIGLSAVVFQDLKSKRIKGYTFDWGRMLQAEGDTGPFVQYTHARLKSIERVTGTHINSTCDLTPLVSSPEAAAVISWLSREDEVLEQSLADMEPAHVVHYLFKLCRLVSRALPSLRVKDMPTHIAEPRMLLFHCSRQSIARCLQILGLPPLEQV
eukprot:m.318317 g.318317  ORF g.318317 m.318317 type:complete len:579 (+) comp20288_c0_seq7:186-1922(+)